MSLEAKYQTARPDETASFGSMTPWGKWVFIMLLGSTFGRTFYYLGVPSAKVFIGDIVLVVFLLLRPREFAGRWFRSLTKPSLLSPFGWVLLLSILYGIFEVLYGLYQGYPVLTALQNLVFNLYPVYFFLGLWIGATHPTALQKVIRWWAWMLAIYGPAYLLFLHNLKVSLPGTSDVPLFPQAGGGGLILLSLLALERRPSRYWLPMGLCAIMMLAAQVRAEWLSTIVAFVLWGTLERKFWKVFQFGALLTVILLVGFITDFDLPSTAERGGSISSREIAARGLSAVSPSLAQEYTASKNTGMYAGTISWRTRWWSAIWDSVSPDHGLSKTFFGNGYGFPLKDLVPYLKSLDLRTPHNIFYYALGYSGWIGVCLFFSLQASLMTMLWKVYKLTGSAYGIGVWTITIVTAFFGNSFESPVGAIPFYLLMGLTIGPVLCRKIIVVPAAARAEVERRANLASTAARVPHLSSGVSTF